MKRRITIQWTETAKQSLRKLPTKVRAGIIAKADELIACNDPKRAYKPLHGLLQGFYRITYGRNRAIYTAEEEELANADVIVRVKILFVAVGIRKEHDK